MIVLDRENSKGLWAYKLIDGIEIKILSEAFRNGKGITHIYHIQDNQGINYLFGGAKGKTYKNYIGYRYDFEDIENCKDVFWLYNSDNEFNFAWEDMKENIINNLS